MVKYLFCFVNFRTDVSITHSQYKTFWQDPNFSSVETNYVKVFIVTSRTNISIMTK